MRRVGQISPKIRLWRLLDDGSSEELFLHAEVKDGVTILSRASAVCYGDRGYSMETLAGPYLQEIAKTQFVFLDIATGSSKERADRWESEPVFVANKSRIDRERHLSQLRSERRRGVKAVWEDKSFDCVIGARSRDVSFDTAGAEKVYSAVAIANRRQFFQTTEHPEFDPLFPAAMESAPATGDHIEIEDVHYEVQAVVRDVGILQIALSEDLSYLGDT